LNNFRPANEELSSIVLGQGVVSHTQEEASPSATLCETHISLYNLFVANLNAIVLCSPCTVFDCAMS